MWEMYSNILYSVLLIKNDSIIKITGIDLFYYISIFYLLYKYNNGFLSNFPIVYPGRECWIK